MTPRAFPFLTGLALLVSAIPAAQAAENTAPAAPATPAATAPALDFAQIGSALTTAFGGFLDHSTAADAAPVGLPDALAKIQAAAKVAGQSALADQLAAKLNSSSSSSFSEATALVKSALSDVPWSEAKTLIGGNSDGATRFLKKSTVKKLRTQLLPLVKKSVASAGVPDQYKQLLDAAGPAATVFGKPGVSDLESYVTDKTLDGVFSYLGKQEAALRANPKLAADPTVQKVFSLLGSQPAPKTGK